MTESVEIVISGDHEREVIGICGYTLIAVIICRPCFFFFFLQSVLLQLSDKITGSEGKSYCVGLRVWIEMLGSNPEAGCRESGKSKDGISRLRCKNGFSKQNSDERAMMKTSAVFHVFPM